MVIIDDLGQHAITSMRPPPTKCRPYLVEIRPTLFRCDRRPCPWWGHPIHFHPRAPRPKVTPLAKSGPFGRFGTPDHPSPSTPGYGPGNTGIQTNEYCVWIHLMQTTYVTWIPLMSDRSNNCLFSQVSRDVKSIIWHLVIFQEYALIKLLK